VVGLLSYGTGVDYVVGKNTTHNRPYRVCLLAWHVIARGLDTEHIGEGGRQGEVRGRWRGDT
jgi:hypothetical protein